MKHKFHRFAVIAAASTAWLVAPPVADASMPGTTSIEAAVTSAGGGPAADGNYQLVFAIYKDAVGGAPVWTEGPLTVGVKGGLFSAALGLKTPLLPGTLAGMKDAWLGLTVGGDPELARVPMNSVFYALRAGLATGLDCSGCVAASQLDPAVLQPYAKVLSLSKAATSGNYADLSGLPDLSVYAAAADLAGLAKTSDLGAYAKTASLGKVAISGAYADLSGLPDLTGVVKKSDLANVAFTGVFADLTGAPVVPKVGVACGSGLVVKGFKADGAIDCIAAVDPANLPPDAIATVSNGLISDVFVDSVAGGTKVLITDNNPLGVANPLTVPDLGLAQKLTITVDVTNSDISTLSLVALDPNGVAYTLYDKGAKGTTVKTGYPSPTATVKGDLTSWVGKNPKGKWTLSAIDTGFLNNTTDGQINSWSVDVQTLSNQKVKVGGNLVVSGSVQIGADGVCDATKAGAIRFTGKVLQLCNGVAWTGVLGADGSSQNAAASDCKAIKAAVPTAGDGLYWVDPNGSGTSDAEQTWCDMTNKGGGWTKVSEFAETAYTNMSAAQRNALPYTEVLILEYDHITATPIYSNFVIQHTCNNVAKTGFQTQSLAGPNCDSGYQVRIGGTGGSCGNGEDGCFGIYAGDTTFGAGLGCSWNCTAGAVTVYGKGFNCNSCRCRNAPYTTTAGCGAAGLWNSKRFWMYVR